METISIFFKNSDFVFYLSMKKVFILKVKLLVEMKIRKKTLFKLFCLLQFTNKSSNYYTKVYVFFQINSFHHTKTVKINYIKSFSDEKRIFLTPSTKNVLFDSNNRFFFRSFLSFHLQRDNLLAFFFICTRKTRSLQQRSPDYWQYSVISKIVFWRGYLNDFEGIRVLRGDQINQKAHRKSLEHQAQIIWKHMPYHCYKAIAMKIV